MARKKRAFFTRGKQADTRAVSGANIAWKAHKSWRSFVKYVGRRPNHPRYDQLYPKKIEVKG